jgi:hypothetical protein
MRAALGIGALALLILGLLAWGGFDQPSMSGWIVVVDAAGVPPFGLGQDDVGALRLCVPRSGQQFVHVQPFTRVIDGRTRWIGRAARFESLQAGQRVRIWTTAATITSDPPQVYALKIEITGDLAAGESDAPCG